jgi:Spy/CpxP family protein refolding chaperone
LELKAEQRQQVEAILREAGEEFARLREELRPRFREIQTRSRGRIKAVLDAGQQAKFDALADEWERRGERRRGRPEEGGRGTGDAGGKRDGR